MSLYGAIYYKKLEFTTPFGSHKDYKTRMRVTRTEMEHAELMLVVTFDPDYIFIEERVFKGDETLPLLHKL